MSTAWHVGMNVDRDCPHEFNACPACMRERALMLQRYVAGQFQEIHECEQHLLKATGCGAPAEEAGGAAGEYVGMDPLGILGQIAANQLTQAKARVQELLESNNKYLEDARASRRETLKAQTTIDALAAQNVALQEKHHAAE